VTATWNSRLRRNLGRQHSVPVEAAAFAALYAGYEALRGLAAGDAHIAVRHGQAIADLERRLHVFLEPNLAHATSEVPGLLAVSSFAYLAFHFAVTVLVLVWLHRGRHPLYPLARTALALASALALLGYLAFPTAPPRLSDLAIPDAVSAHGIGLSHGLISALYNPYAAVPSLHTAYAVVTGMAVVAGARRMFVRVLGAVYPLLVVLIIVATGNHFFLDAAAGALTAACSLTLAALVLRGGDQRVRERAYRPSYGTASS
jgi:PAP2 superfamily